MKTFAALASVVVFSAAPLHAQTDQSPFEKEQTGAIVLIAPRSHALVTQARHLLRSPELAEFGLRIINLVPNPASTNKFYTYAAKHIDTSEPAWALFTPSGRAIAKGSAPPTVAQIATALAEAGIKTPAETLSAFLRANPGHTEARGQLMEILRKKTMAQTRRELDIDAKSLWERLEDELTNSISYSATDFPDTSSYESKKLDSEKDLEIWGQYASEFDRVFNDGSWCSLIPILSNNTNYVPVELCSPLMVMAYTRHLPKIEEKLIALPGRFDLWGIWIYFVNIAGKNRGAALINAFPDIPPELRISWPPSALVEFLVKNAKDSGDWLLVRNLLDSFWERMKSAAEYDAKSEKQQSDPNYYRSARMVNWQVNYSPLLESMIRLHSDTEAHEFVHAVLSSPETRHLKDNCIEMAIKCEREDLAEAWGKLQ
jgi:hypothetical protein